MIFVGQLEHGPAKVLAVTAGVGRAFRDLDAEPGALQLGADPAGLRSAREAPMSPALDSAWAVEGRQPAIAIIGAGMSGIAAVVKLRRAGYTDLTVFEKTDRVGGTWRENTYPGLSCDVPSHWYSFTFAPNPDWSHRFSYGPEIQAYMEKVARDFGVTDIVRFNTPVTKLDYQAPTWRLTTGAGEELEYDVVIAATGILHKPAYPEIEGLESFAGDCFHSARCVSSLTASRT